MIDENEGLPFIRRTTEDKLTYKNIIADAINWCRKTMGTLQFRYAVQGLERVIKFDVPGYNMKKELNELETQLKKQQKQLIEEKKQEYGNRFFKRSVQAKFRIDMIEWYWNTYFEMIIQLLANHNLLFDTEKRIPIKKIRDTDE